MDRSVLAGTLRARGFQVVEPLKCAGHATIFRVQEKEEPGAEAYVAKVVSLSGLDAKGRASAQQEVSLLKGLAPHPNLIAYRDSFMEEAGMLYIVMSLAEDGDLRRVVTEFQASKKPLPETVVLSYVRQTLSGLQLLHKQGVVHRDLKSSNIFLCNGRRRLRIGDFGISRVLESTAFASSCVGTPAYMSPELMRNERYDYHVDMWALGCISFELCTLELPFKANSLLELACQVMEKDPDWELWGSFSVELRDTAKRLLSKETAGRPTAAELLAEPLFVEGGRGAIEPSEEVWVSLAPSSTDKTHSPDRRVENTQQSQMSTNPGTEDSQSSGFSLTPRMPWEKQKGANNDTNSTSFGSPGGSLRPGEFAEMVSTHQEELLKGLHGAPKSHRDGQAGVQAPLETVM